MDIFEELLKSTAPDNKLFWEWQFYLARRIVQEMEQRNLSQRDVAKLTQLTEAQVSTILHSSSNPRLSTLARIATGLSINLLTWENKRMVQSEPQARVHQLDEYVPYDMEPTEAMTDLDYALVHEA